MKNKRIGLLSVSMSMVAALFAGTYFADDNSTKDSLGEGVIVRDLTQEEIDHPVYAQPFEVYDSLATDNKKYKNGDQDCSMNILGNGTDMEDVWNAYRGDGTTIAIIDTGIDYNHPDFKFADGTSKILETSRYYRINDAGTQVEYYQKGVNASDLSYLDHVSKLEGSSYKLQKHGTNVASAAASAINGNGGTVGIAPNAKLLVLKTDMNLSSINEAIKYATSQKVDVINMSLGAYATSFVDGNGVSQTGYASTSTTLSSAIISAHNAGVIVVAAAGNEKTSVASYPANNTYVIGVGALASKQYTSANFSNYNPSTSTSSTTNVNVDLSAPGYVYTADETATVSGTSVSNRDHSFCNTQGTSFASPIVAGAAALWKQANPNGKPAEFESALYAACDDIGTSGWDTTYGHGALNIKKLLLSDSTSASSISIKAKDNVTSGKKDDHVQLYTQTLPLNTTNKDVTWSTSDSSIASVNGYSNVLTFGSKGGTATITATDTNNSNAKGTIQVTNTEGTGGTETGGGTGTGGGESETLTTTFTFTSKTDFTETGSTNATMAASGTIQGFDSSSGRGVQWSKNDATVTISNFPSDVTITKITITVSGNGSSNGTATIKVGGSSFGSSYALTKTNNQTNSFTGSASGSIIVLSITKGGSSTWVKSISIEYNNGGGEVTPTPTNYTVTFNSNGGSGTMANATTNGSSYVVPACTFTKTNYDFDKWALGSATGTKYAVGETISGISGNITLYATWEAKVINYSVTFNSNGGSGTMANATTNGSSYVVPACTFTKENYDFDKWALGSATGTKYAVGETISNISSNITLYATWTEKQSTGGDDATTRTATFVDTDFPSAYPTSATELVKDNLTFKFEKTANFGNGIQFQASNGKIYNVSSLGKIKSVSMTEKTGKSHTNLKVAFGSTQAAAASATGSALTTSGVNGSDNSFFCITNGSGAAYAETITVEYVLGGGDTPTPTPTDYTVSFNSNGGSGTMANATTNGSSYVVPACTFTKENYDFDKWALGSATGTKYAVGETISNISSNITLYATWKETQSSGGDGDLSYWTKWISDNSSALSTGGTTLVTALRNKIANVTPGTSNTLSYDDLWNAYATTDGIPGSNGTRIYDMYGGFEFRKGTDQAGQYQKEGDVYNREHSVPKSWFSEKAPAISDIIHVVPTDGKVNGMRSNNTFGEVSNASYSYSFPARSYNGVEYQKAGISKLGTPKAINGVTTSEGVVFEPDDQYKGDFARIYMYFAVRYGNTTCSATTGSGSAIFTNTFTNANPYVTNYGLALLKKWHEQDPVSEKERLRNDGVEKVQGNRNPFVDYPQWADKIFGTNTPGGDTPTPTKTLSSISVSGQKTSYVVGDSFVAPTVTAHYSDNSTATVTATFSGYDLNTVGDQTVTVSYTEGGVEKTTTYDITVSAATIAVTGVALNKKSLELNVGDSETLTATVSPNNATNKAVTWESSNPSVATVSNGLITAISAGSATITVKTVDGNKTDTCAVTVKSSGSTGGATSYTKITSAAELTSGDYLIVSEARNTALNGSLDSTKLGVSGNHIGVTISNNSIEATETVNGYSFTYDASNGSFLSSSGNYIYHTGSSNTLNTSSTAQSNTVSFDTNGNVAIVCGGYQLCVNGDLYRYYKTSDVGKYNTVQLYKKASGSTPEPEKEIVSVELECNVSEVNFGVGKGTTDIPAKLKATYSDSTTGFIVPNEFNYTVNTYKLGKQTIYAIYNGVRYEKTITVSNNNADIGDSSGESKKASVTGGTWDSYVTDNGTDCLEYNLSGSQSEKIQIQRQHCASTTGGFQFKKDTAGSIFNISDNGKINSISFSGSGDSLVLYGGDTKDTCNNLISPKAATASGEVMAMAGTTSYEYDLSGSDYHFFKITRPSISTTTTVTNISITYGDGANSHDSTPLQQTISWSQYFLDMTYAVCSLNSDGDNSEGLSAIWSDLSTEYGYMNSDSKSLFMSSDDETVMAARERYIHIANHYGKNLNNFAGVASASRNSFNLFNSLDTFNSDHPENILTLILALTGAATIACYFIVKKRKEI